MSRLIKDYVEVGDHTSLDEYAGNPLDTLAAFPNSVLAESVRGIYSATHIPVMGRAKVLAVTSALPGEGKTMLSAMLGLTASSSGARAVVVDCDIMLRGLSRLAGFDYDDGPGLRTLISGKCTLEDAVRAQAMPAAAEAVEVRVAALGEDRLLIGAAEAAFGALLEDPLGPGD